MPSSDPISTRQKTALAAAFLGWMFDGFEMGIFPLVARPALQQMTNFQANDAFVGHWMGIITALFLFGAAVGGWMFGWLGDRLGRVKAMTLAVLMYSAFTGLACLARSPTEFGTLRFIAALGMGGEWSLGVALVMEIWPEHRRGVLAGLIGAANNLGFALVAVLGLAVAVTPTTWRWIVLAGAFPAILAFVIRRYVPESERWLSVALTRRIEPLREALRPPFLGRVVLATVFGSIALIGSWGSVQWLPLWADQMAGPDLPRAKALTQAVTAVGAIAGAFLGALMGQRLGRRPAFFILCFGSLFGCAALFRGIIGYGFPFLALTGVVGLLTSGFYGWLPLYLPELFPTRLRATAQGIAFNSGRVLAGLGALQMGALMAHFSGSYARAGAIVTLVYAVGCIAIWFAPETKGQPLTD